MLGGVRTIFSSTRVTLLGNNNNLSHNVKSFTTTRYPFAIWSWKQTVAEKEAVALEEDKKSGLLSLEDFTSAPKTLELTEEEILAKRNKSGLRFHHYRMLHGEVPYETPMYWTHHTVKYKARTYGKYGEKSGVNPGLMWPTHKDLDHRLEYEQIAHPLTIQEMMEKKKEFRKLEAEEFEARERDIDQKLKKMDAWKKEIFARRAAKEQEIARAKAKKEALLEEVRRHFGYNIDPRDEQFQELLEKKELAMKKAHKEAKKLERQKLLMAKLTEGITKEVKVQPEKEEFKPAEENEEDKETEKKKIRNTAFLWAAIGGGGIPGSHRMAQVAAIGGGGIPGGHRMAQVVAHRTLFTADLSSPPSAATTTESSASPSVVHITNSSSSSPIEPHKLVESDLHDLVKDIRKELGGRHLELCDVAAYYFDGQGKAIRPLISILMARAINAHLHGNNSFILLSQKQLALVSEMIHTATLVHDDVIDTSDTRRGKPSVNALFGQKKAIIGGDYILAKAGAMVAGLNNDEVTQILAQVLEDLVQGEFMQMGANEGTTERFAHYIGKTFNKTASLMAYSCKGVAILGGSDESLAEIAFQYGKNVGIAFQLVDDRLDFVSSTATMGKPAAADLQLGLATAPVLYAAQKHPALYELIERRFADEGDVEKALDYVHNSDGLEETKLLAQKYCLEAVRYANKLRDSSYRSALITVTEMVLNRSK